MKFINYLSVFAITIFCFSSCSNQEGLIDLSNNELIQTKTISDELETFTLTLIYKDKIYQSLCESRNDSLFVLDKDVETLQKQIFENPNYVSLVKNNDSIEYFDSQEEFLKEYGIRELTEKEKENLRFLPQPRDPMYNSIGYAVLFDDTKFKDTRYEMDITDPLQDYFIESLKDYGMNDKASSLKVQYTFGQKDYCAMLTVWEDADFNAGDSDRTKHRTNFIATYTQSKLEIPNLKNVSCWHAHDSWNDRISSCVFRIGKIGTQPSEY